MTINFDLFPLLLQGARVTMQLTLISAVLAFFLALLAGLARLSTFWLINILASIYIEIFRGTSLLVQMFWFYFVFPFFGVSFSPLVAGVLVLGLNIGAYGAEVVRGAVLSVPKGQIEAAIAINMSPLLRMRRVILPQALLLMLPPFGNLLIELLKSTALVSLVTLSDLTFQGMVLRNSLGRTTEIFIWLLILYFVMAYPLILGVRWLERHLSKHILEH